MSPFRYDGGYIMEEAAAAADSEEEMRELEASLYSQIHFAMDDGDVEEQGGSTNATAVGPTVLPFKVDEVAMSEETSTAQEPADNRVDDDELAVLPTPQPSRPPVITLEESSETSDDDEDDDAIIVLSQPEVVRNANSSSSHPSDIPTSSARPSLVEEEVKDEDSDSSVLELDGTEISLPESKKKKQEDKKEEEIASSLARLIEDYRFEVAKKEESSSKNKKSKEPPKKRRKVEVTVETDAGRQGLAKNPLWNEAGSLSSSDKKKRLSLQHDDSSSSDALTDDDGEFVLSSDKKSSRGGGGGDMLLNLSGRAACGDRGGVPRRLLSVREALGPGPESNSSYSTALFGAPVPPGWTEEMARFYNEPDGDLDHPTTLEDILSSMPSDPDRWKVDKADLYRDTGSPGMTGRKRPRYFEHRPKRCNNCDEPGHVARECPEPKKEPVCTMCGGQGHLRFGCPDRRCLRCGKGGLPFTPSCSSCRHLDRSDCRLCGARGHLRADCPDLWRRFHSTVEPGSAPSVPEEDPHVCAADSYCPNCGRRGHLVHQCRAYRNSPYPATVTGVVSYADPQKGHEDYSSVGKSMSKRQRRLELKEAKRALKRGFSASAPATPLIQQQSAKRRKLSAAMSNTKKYFDSEPASPQSEEEVVVETGGGGSRDAELKKSLEEALRGLDSDAKKKKRTRRKRCRKRKQNQEEEMANDDGAGIPETIVIDDDDDHFEVVAEEPESNARQKTKKKIRDFLKSEKSNQASAKKEERKKKKKKGRKSNPDSTSETPFAEPELCLSVEEADEGDGENVKFKFKMGVAEGKKKKNKKRKERNNNSQKQRQRGDEEEEDIVDVRGSSKTLLSKGTKKAKKKKEKKNRTLPEAKDELFNMGSVKAFLKATKKEKMRKKAMKMAEKHLAMIRGKYGRRVTKRDEKKIRERVGIVRKRDRLRMEGEQNEN